jgi:hypothetical protein
MAGLVDPTANPYQRKGAVSVLYGSSLALVGSLLLWLRFQQTGAPAWERWACRIVTVGLGALVGLALLPLLPCT